MYLTITRFFLIIILLVGIKITNAQCPISINLSSTPSVLEAPFCKNTPIQISATPSAGVISPTYIWVINGDTISGTGANINIAANNQTVTVFMNTNTGCFPDVASASMPIETVIITSQATPQTQECNQTVADVQITAAGGQPTYSYNLIGVGTNNTGFFNDVSVGSYQVLITDGQGCSDTNVVDIAPFECPDPIPVEVFTPNGDGFNDTWFIRFLEFYDENEVFIFDRWGQRVYHKKDYKNTEGWDAKYLGGDLPVSTFYYVLEVKSENSEKQTFKGAVSIMR